MFQKFAGLVVDFGIHNSVVDILASMEFVPMPKMCTAQLPSFVEAAARGADVTVLEIFVGDSEISFNNSNNHF